MHKPLSIIVCLLLCCVLSLSACSLPFSRSESAPTLPQGILPATEPEYVVPSASAVPQPTTEAPVSASPYGQGEDWEKAYTWAQSLYSSMDEADRLLQLFIVQPEAVSLTSPVLDVEGWELANRPVGGIVLNSDNMQNRLQFTTLLKHLQGSSRFPLFLCVSEEFGKGSILSQKFGTTSFASLYSYRGDGPVKAYDNALIQSAEIRSLGLNVNLSVTADVWSDPANRSTGTRSFSDSFEKSALLLSYFVDGYRERNLLCALSLFPGLGEAKTRADGSLIVDKDRQTLSEEEWQTFRAGIDHGVEFIRLGRVLAPAIDPENEICFSPEAVRILREELGFQGLILSDKLTDEDLEQKAENCVRALSAGCDLLFCPVHSTGGLDGCVEALQEAIGEGRLSWERVEESVLRILTIKIYRELLS